MVVASAGAKRIDVASYIRVGYVDVVAAPSDYLVGVEQL